MACPPDLLAFVQLCDGNEALEERVRRCQHPGELLELISNQGLSVSIKELMAYSGDLNTAYWPWLTAIGSSRRSELFRRRP